MEDNAILTLSKFREPADPFSEESPVEILETAEIHLSDQLQEPPVVIESIGSNFSAGICTLGNFSLLKGKAKSRKTFATTIIMAAAIRNSEIMQRISGNLPKGKQTILYFDTEQAAFHVQRMAERVTRLAGLENPENFKIYTLRKFTYVERLKLIETALTTIQGIGFVVIDGIRDLVSDINDQKEATTISSKLLKWTEELGIHILTVLHENKGNEFARGHLGSELVNKAETVLTVAKSPDNENISIVEAEFCRDREPKPFAFSIDETGLPSILDWQPADKTKLNTPGSISIENHKQILKLAFTHNDRPKYKDLVTQLKLACDKNGVKIGDNKAKDFITWYLNEDHITKNGRDGSRDTFYTLNWLV